VAAVQRHAPVRAYLADGASTPRATPVWRDDSTWNAPRLCAQSADQKRHNRSLEASAARRSGGALALAIPVATAGKPLICPAIDNVRLGERCLVQQFHDICGPVHPDLSSSRTQCTWPAVRRGASCDLASGWLSGARTAAPQRLLASSGASRACKPLRRPPARSFFAEGGSWWRVSAPPPADGGRGVVQSRQRWWVAPLPCSRLCRRDD